MHICDFTLNEINFWHPNKTIFQGIHIDWISATLLGVNSVVELNVVKNDTKVKSKAARLFNRMKFQQEQLFQVAGTQFLESCCFVEEDKRRYVHHWGEPTTKTLCCLDEMCQCKQIGEFKLKKNFYKPWSQHLRHAARKRGCSWSCRVCVCVHTCSVFVCIQ